LTVSSQIDIEALASILAVLRDLPGVGVDVESVSRFAEPDPRLFTTDELAHCALQPNPAESRAGRWCAKEAVSKGCAKYVQLSLREIEIRSEASGRPTVRLPARAVALGLVADVSIAHSSGLAVAVAVVVVSESRQINQ
jgi:phosphopantetheine--protein transferase-like protein